MKPLSVGRRLLGGSLVIALIVMPLTGLGLAWSFRDAVTTAFDQRLLSLSKVLIAAIQFDREKGRPGLTRSLGDPRFDQAYSGWYWQISDRNGNVLTSRSLWDQRLPPLEDMDKGVIISRDLKGPRHQVLRSLERDIRLPGRNQPLHVMVAASRSEVDAEVARGSGHQLRESARADGRDGGLAPAALLPHQRLDQARAEVEPRRKLGHLGLVVGGHRTRGLARIRSDMRRHALDRFAAVERHDLRGFAVHGGGLQHGHFEAGNGHADLLARDPARAILSDFHYVGPCRGR